MPPHDPPTRDLPPRDHPTADPSAVGHTADLADATLPHPTAAVLPAVPGFELVEEVGRGGMGAVYHAKDLAFGRDVAVKLLQDRYPAAGVAARRFLDEARITGQLQHPGVPAAYQTGTLADGRPFLAMKLIKGRTLDDLLASGGHAADHRPLPQGERVEVGTDAPGSPNLIAAFEKVCEAVGYAHAHGVVHRDLKPQNVMVGAFGEVQVMDWGLAKLLRNADWGMRNDDEDPDATALLTPHSEIRVPHSDQTQAGSILGTAAFMPPEQAIGAVDEVDRRSDVFGLGAVLCAVLTGRPPYAGETAESTRKLAARADLADAHARLDGCGADPGLVALCKRCLSVRREDRPADGGEVAGAVARLRAEADDRARQADLDRTRAEGDLKAARVEAVEGRKRRRVQRLLAAAGVALVAGGAGVVWREDRREEARRAEEARREADRQVEAAAAEARARQAVEGAVALSADLREKFRFAEARAALDHAAGLVPADAPADVAGRLARARDDLELVRRLDEIRLSRLRSDVRAGGRAVPADYRAAFRARGVDPSADDPDAVAGWVDRSPVRRHLLAAVDDWAMWDEAPGMRARLWAVARRADPGAWSDRLRDPAVRHSSAAVGRVAAEADVAGLPPHLLVLLYQMPEVMWPGATPALVEVAARLRDDFWVQLEAGYHFIYKDQDPAAAAGHLRAALAVRPDVPYALVMLAGCLDRLGDPAGAAAVWRDLHRVDPENPEARSNVEAAAAAGKGGPGRKVAAAHLRLADALAMKLDPGGALAAYRAAVRADPGYAEAQYRLGFALAKVGPTDEAAAALREAARLRPWETRALTELGGLLDRRGDLGGAEEAYREALRRAPADRWAHNNFGYILSRKGDMAGAAAAYREAIRLDPWVSRFHTNLGLALAAAGDAGGAEAAFREAVRLAPKDAGLRHNLGLLLVERGDFARAAEVYREATEALPDNAMLQRNRAEVDRAAALAARLPAVRAGADRPATPKEAVELAVLAATPVEHDYGLSVRLFGDAFAADRGSARVYRYLAACAAVMAGEQAAPAVGWDEWGAFQDRAFAWLAADLADLRRLSRSAAPAARKRVGEILAHWLANPELAAVREPARRAWMPAPDRDRWEAFWAEVEAVRATAAPPVAPPPREAGR